MHAVAELLRLAATSRAPSLTRDELRVAATELTARGLRLREIAQALGVAEVEVARLITEPRHEHRASFGEVSR